MFFPPLYVIFVDRIKLNFCDARTDEGWTLDRQLFAILEFAILERFSIKFNLKNEFCMGKPLLAHSDE